MGFVICRTENTTSLNTLSKRKKNVRRFNRTIQDNPCTKYNCRILLDGFIDLLCFVTAEFHTSEAYSSYTYWIKAFGHSLREVNKRSISSAALRTLLAITICSVRVAWSLICCTLALLSLAHSYTHYIDRFIDIITRALCILQKVLVVILCIYDIYQYIFIWCIYIYIYILLPLGNL